MIRDCGDDDEEESASHIPRARLGRKVDEKERPSYSMELLGKCGAPHNKANKEVLGTYIPNRVFGRSALDISRMVEVLKGLILLRYDEYSALDV